MSDEAKLICRFLNNVEFIESTGCWNWIGRLSKKGYGLFGRGTPGYSHLAHRVAHRLFLNQINYPETILLLHSCDNRKCVNPWHTNPGTNAQNMREMMERGNPSMCKLTEEQVLKILNEYEWYKTTQDMLAKKYNVNPVTIHQIIRHKTWKHLTQSETILQNI